jgi:hypothetical protein
VTWASVALSLSFFDFFFTRTAWHLAAGISVTFRTLPLPPCPVAQVPRPEAICSSKDKRTVLPTLVSRPAPCSSGPDPDVQGSDLRRNVALKTGVLPFPLSPPPAVIPTAERDLLFPLPVPHPPLITASVEEPQIAALNAGWDLVFGKSSCKFRWKAQLDFDVMIFSFSSSAVTILTSSLIAFIADLASNTLVVPVHTSSPSGFAVE